MGNLPSGQHLIRAYADGYLFAEHSFLVFNFLLEALLETALQRLWCRTFPRQAVKSSSGGNKAYKTL
ncbi:MAG: hypothetical protein CM15mP92_2420 [Halieaceae bacterium]|nr:MAG: hypothetical protein CM15mP92_2420 [Halieaceae bacterium]